MISIVEGQGRGRGVGGDPRKGGGKREAFPRLLLSNLEGNTYLIGRVKGGDSLAPPLLHLQETLQSPLTPAAAREDLAHHLPLHGVSLKDHYFTLEEELRGMCLFTKEARHVLHH